MKRFLNAIIMALVTFIKKYPEILSVPAAMAVWIASVTVLRWFDPTSAVFDAGVFQIPIFAALQLFIYISIAWLVLGLVFGTMRKFLVTDLKTHFSNLSSWKKLKLAYGLFAFLLFCLVLLSYTLR
jgi:hypothetical protein